jgi:signal transduction histidine kinase/DNA-binding response OmpR family regulator
MRHLLATTLLLATNFAWAVALEQPMQRPSFKLSQVDLGNQYLHANPIFVFRSKDGSLWSIYDNIILRKQGLQIVKYPLPGERADYYTPEYSSLIKSSETQDTIFVAYNSQLIYFDKQQQLWRVWEELPFKGELITGLQVLKDQSIWLSTIKKLYFSKGLHSSFQPVSIPKGVQHKKSALLLATNMYKDSSDTLWISSFLSTMFRVEYQKGKPPQIIKITLPGVGNRIIHDIKKLDSDELLIGVSDGLFRYSVKNSELTPLTQKDQVSYVTHLQITEDNFWFNSNEKIYFLDRETEQLLQINQDNLPFDNSNYSALGLFSDDKDNIWLPIKGNGLLQYSPYFNRVRMTPAPLSDLRSLRLMTATNNGDIVVSSAETTRYINDAITLPRTAYSFFDDTQYAYFGESGKVSKFFGDRLIEEYAIPGVKTDISSIAVDPLKRIWAVDDLKGLFIFNTDLGSLASTQEIETKGPEQVRFLTNFNNEIVLFFGNKIRTIDSSKKELTILNSIETDTDIIRSSSTPTYVVSLHKDHRVSLYDLETKSLQYFSFDQVENFGCAIYLGHDEWWIAESNGDLYHYPKNSKSPKRYTTSDGVPKGGLDGQFCLKHNDDLLFTSHAGIVKTNPKYLFDNENASETIVSSIKTANMTYQKQALDSVIELLPNDFPISIQFYPTSLTFPGYNSSRYKINGTNNNWITIKDSSQEISFNQLKRGQHSLSIQTINSDRVWGDETTLKLIVKPPLWQTWWAMLSYFLAMLGVIYLFSQYRTRAIRQRAEKLEATVATRTQQLEQVLDKKNEEFANVSHEFRTPLTLVIGPLQKLLTDETNQDRKNSLSMVKRNAFRLLRMVDQLLHLEKFRVQQIVKKVPIRVQPTAKLIAESFAELAKENDISMIIDQIDDIWIQFTPDALEKILLNLLSNAVKYSQPGDTINFSILKDSENSLRIVVKDSGIGIPKNKQAEIFERFSRVLDNHSEQITGAGIGLSLVKELVEGHDGRITLKSALGEGCCFTVILPTIPEPLATQNTNTSTDDEEVINELNNEILDMEIESLVEQTHKPDSDSQIQDSDLSDSLPTLLIVEDNHDMRNYITSTLSNRYNILTAPNGKEGLALAREHIPDLVVSDVMMPQMDGFTLCHELKSGELTSHIPLILLTARSDRDSRLRGWKEQADEYLTKPFDAEELNLRVNNLLDIRELLKQRFYSSMQSQPEQLYQPMAESSGEDDENSQWEDHQKEFLKRFIEQIETNIENPQLKVAEIAKSLAMTERQLYRKLKGVINVTPSEYLKNYRLDKALSLLKNGEPVGNVAFDVGFTSHSYFSRCFKAKFGKSPSEFAD